MNSPERFGNRRVPKMYAEINALRRAIAAEASPAIQEAWDRVEKHLDYAYAQNGQKDTLQALVREGADLLDEVRSKESEDWIKRVHTCLFDKGYYVKEKAGS